MPSDRGIPCQGTTTSKARTKTASRQLLKWRCLLWDNLFCKPKQCKPSTQQKRGDRFNIDVPRCVVSFIRAGLFWKLDTEDIVKTMMALTNEPRASMSHVHLCCNMWIASLVVVWSVCIWWLCFSLVLSFPERACDFIHSIHRQKRGWINLQPRNGERKQKEASKCYAWTKTERFACSLLIVPPFCSSTGLMASSRMLSHPC